MTAAGLTESSADRWLVRPRTRLHAGVRLFCFPYAGGGASAYRQWADCLPAEIELCAVQLPGREQRLGETPFSRLPGLVGTLAEALGPELETPFAFFGHSMGALIAFELARELRRRNAPLPERLLVSGRRAPQVPSHAAPVHDLPLDAFLDELAGLGGTPVEVLRHAELMQLLVPLLRADFALNETYVYADEPPLPCPVSAFTGRDDPLADPDEVERWREHAGGGFTLRTFDGGHFFLREAQDELLGWIAHDLLAGIER